MASDVQMKPSPQPAGALVAGPRGVGMGVAFDWALTAQLALMAPLFVLAVGPGSVLAHAALALRLLVAVGSVLAGIPLLVQGEALRRGSMLARRLQIGFNALLTISGVFGLPGALAEVGTGHYSGLVRAVVLLVISPLIVWLLLRPVTAAWYLRVTSAEARARHGGARWLGWIVVWAIVGGAAIAFGSFY